MAASCTPGEWKKHPVSGTRCYPSQPGPHPQGWPRPFSLPPATTQGRAAWEGWGVGGDSLWEFRRSWGVGSPAEAVGEGRAVQVTSARAALGPPGDLLPRPGQKPGAQHAVGCTPSLGPPAHGSWEPVRKFTSSDPRPPSHSGLCTSGKSRGHHPAPALRLRGGARRVSRKSAEPQAQPHHTHTAPPTQHGAASRCRPSWPQHSPAEPQVSWGPLPAAPLLPLGSRLRQRSGSGRLRRTHLLQAPGL